MGHSRAYINNPISRYLIVAAVFEPMIQTENLVVTKAIKCYVSSEMNSSFAVNHEACRRVARIVS